ncbi:MAG: BrnT family toxin [Undibacterium sp.]|nr:BrnT family toxin [Opitutaceae bacterium]
MPITFDPAKRAKALAERGLDFADADAVFEGAIFEFVDDRFDYGEKRITTAGYLRERLVVVVWTERGVNRHIISMRHSHGKEQRRFKARMD